MPSYQYFASLNDAQVLASLLRIEKKFDDIESKGNGALKGVGVSGIAFGNIIANIATGAVSTLTSSVIRFGQDATQAIADVIIESQQMGAEFEATKRKFTAIFEGNEQLATDVMDHIRQRAAKLGLDMNAALSVSRAFMPDVKGTDDPLMYMDKLLDVIKMMSEEDPLQGIKGARFALDEAVSGNLRSLQTRFEFTKTEINIVKDTAKELGPVVGIIEGISKVMERRGASIQVFQGTFANALGQLTTSIQEFQIAMGRPTTEQLTESFRDILSVLKDNEDSIKAVSTTFGDFIARIIDLVSSGIIDELTNFDPSTALEFVEALNSVVDGVSLMLTAIKGSQTEFSVLNGLFNLLSVTANTIAFIIKAWATDIAIAKGAVIGITTAMPEVVAMLQLIVGASQLLTGQFYKGAENIATGIRTINDAIGEGKITFNPGAGIDAAKDSLKEYSEQLKELELQRQRREWEFKKLMESLGKEISTDEIRDSLKEWGRDLSSLTEEELNQLKSEVEALENTAKQADAAYKEALQSQGLTDYTKGLADQAEEAKKAAEKLRKLYEEAKRLSSQTLSAEQLEQLEKAKVKITEIEKDAQRDLLDILEKGAYDLLKAEETFSKEREEIHRKYLDKIEKDEIERNRDLATASKEGDREIEDITREARQKEVDARKTAVNSLIKIEQDYRNELKKIRQQLIYDLEDAEKEQDAIAFVAAIERANRAQEQAGSDKNIKAEEIRAQQELEIQEARDFRERSLEEARIANQREIDDINEKYDRLAQDRKREYDIELREQEIKENEKRAELEESINRQIELSNKGNQRKLADYIESLDAEVRALVEAEQQKLEILKQSALDQAKIVAQTKVAPEQLGSGSSVKTSGVTSKSKSNAGAVPKALGGDVYPGVKYLVGEEGPELLTVKGKGTITPNKSLAALKSTSTMLGSSTKNTNFAPTFSLYNPATLTPEQQVLTRDLAEDVALKVYTQLMSEE